MKQSEQITLNEKYFIREIFPPLFPVYVFLIILILTLY